MLKVFITSVISISLIFPLVKTINAVTSTAPPSTAKVIINSDIGVSNPNTTNPVTTITGAQLETFIKNNPAMTELNLTGVTVAGGFKIENRATALALYGGGSGIIDLSPDGVQTVNIDHSNGTIIDGFNIKQRATSAAGYKGDQSLAINESNNVKIQNNVIEVGSYSGSEGNGIGVAANSGSGIQITGNEIKSAGGTAFRPMYVNPGVTSIEINGNTFSGSFSSAVISEAADLMFNNNIFDDSFITSSGFSLVIFNDTDAKVDGNKFLNYSQTGCIRIGEGANAIVTNNEMRSAILPDGTSLGIQFVRWDKTAGPDGKGAYVTITGTLSTYSGNTRENIVYTLKQNADGQWYIPAPTPTPTTPTTNVSDSTKDTSTSTKDTYTYTSIYDTTQTYTTYSTTVPEPTTILEPVTEVVPTKDKKKDVKLPIIKAKDLTICVNSTFNIMKGVTAFENNGKGKQITKNVTSSGTVNTSKPGEYKITYRVKDQYGNKATATRIITVVEDCSKKNK